MTLQTDLQTASRVIDAMAYHLGAGFMCKDNTGLTVRDVVARQYTHLAEKVIGKIALTALGSNLPGAKDKIRNLKFVNA